MTERNILSWGFDLEGNPLPDVQFNRIFINGPIGICASEIECGEGPFISSLSEKYPLCNCPISQLMLKGCTCGGN